MEGGVVKRKREEEPGNRSFSAASDSERTAENAKETGRSEYRGVQFDTKNNRWRARLHTDKTRHVGYFETEEESARAWDQAALRYSCDNDTLMRLNFAEESFAKFKEFVEESGPLDRFLPDLKGVEKKTLDTVPPMVVYVASINQNRSTQTIGEFFSARDAAKAYDWKTLEKFGWGNLTNFPLANYEYECIARCGLSGLDNNMMPNFPNIKRFAESRKVLPQLAGGNTSSVDDALQSLTTSVQAGPMATNDGNAHISEHTFQFHNKATHPMVRLMEMDSNKLLSQLIQQHLGQSGQQIQLPGPGPLLLHKNVASTTSDTGLNPDAITRHEGLVAPVGTSSMVAPVAPQVGATQAQPTAAIQATTQNTAAAPMAPPAPVPTQAPVATATLVSPSAPAVGAAPNIPAVASTTTHEALAKVSLGTFEDMKAAQDAMDRAEPMIKGISRLQEDEYQKHVELIQRSQAKLQDKIKEMDGEFHVSLKILGKSFELGPYHTIQEARMAHDKYSIVLDGASAQTFNTITDVLLPREESESLLFALNKIRGGTTPPPPLEGNASSPAAAHLRNVSEIPQSSLVANAFTSTLRKVASQSSLLDEAANLNKQLEKIESSVGKVTNVLDASSPFAARDTTTPCPLPAFPGVPGANINTNMSHTRDE